MVILILTALIGIALIGLVLVQKSKGGGLSSQFSGMNSVAGVRNTNKFLENTTWTLAGLLALMSIISAFTTPKATDQTKIRTKTEAAAPVPAANQYGQDAPAAPVAPAAPAQEAPAAGE